MTAKLFPGNLKQFDISDFISYAMWLPKAVGLTTSENIEIPYLIIKDGWNHQIWKVGYHYGPILFKINSIATYSVIIIGLRDLKSSTALCQ